jgi:CHAT domain-containing protein
MTELPELARSTRLERPPTTDALWTSAVIDLATSNHDPTIDAATQRLNILATEHASEPAILNDLAVARLVSATTRGDGAAMFEALDAIERAAETEPDGEAITFNRGLILQRIGLPRAATEAWAAYLRHDSTSGWAREVRGMLTDAGAGRQARYPRDLGLPAISDSAIRELALADPQGAREHAIDDVLPRWARAFLAGDSAAAVALREARTIGSTLASIGGDSSVIHAAGVIGDATGQRRRLIATGLDAYGAGARDFSRAEFRRASPQLRLASRALDAARGSSLAAWADLLSGAIDVYDRRYAAAASRFNAVAASGERRSNLALQARAHWGLALAAARRGQHDIALRYYDNAARVFERLGETANRAAMVSQHGDVLFGVGRDEDALSAKALALETLERKTETPLRHGLLLELGTQLNEVGLAAAGRAVLREAASSADSTRPKDRPEALIQLAGAEVQAGQLTAARADLAAASGFIRGSGDELMRQRLAAEDAAVSARLLAASDPRAAIELQSRVVDYYDKQGLAILLAPSLVSRALLRLAVADSAGAERDLGEAAQTLARQSTPSDPESLRELAASRRGVFQTLLRLRLARRDTAGAFAYAEQSRGAVPALGRVGSGRSAVAYTVLDDETLVWAATSRGVRLHRVAVRADSLRMRVDEYERLLHGGPNDAAGAQRSRDLYDMLLRGVAEELGDTRELVIVPDDALGRLPFATLRDERGRYVIDRFAVGYVASMAAAERNEQARYQTPTGRNVVLIGNPAFSSQSFPGLEPLRGADREVEHILELYPSARVIRGGGATRSAVAQALITTEVFHFAGHARLVERSPHSSHLVLAEGDAGESGMLTAADIARLDLRRVRLAILSACGTAQTRARRHDVDAGLASAFLDAGATAVVSTLWEADDDATAFLMVALHRELRRGVPGPEALRRAQLATIHERASFAAPVNWGGFRYDGG